jgi:single-strand DNA-binding protein
MKSITIAGRTGKDAELRRLQDGTPVLSFSVAVDDGYGESKKTMWFDCAFYGNRGAALEKHLVKGTPVTVAGDFGKREHEGKTYLQVRVNDLDMQGSAKPQSDAPARTKREEPAGSYGAPDLDDLDEVPF